MYKFEFFRTNRLVYENQTGSSSNSAEIAPQVMEESEKPNTLRDAIKKAHLELEKCNTRIAKIDGYYKQKDALGGARTMPGKVRKSYDEYKKKKVGLEKMIKEYERKLNSQSDRQLQSDEKENAVKTMTEIREALAKFKKEQGANEQEREHDPMNGDTHPLTKQLDKLDEEDKVNARLARILPLSNPDDDTPLPDFSSNFRPRPEARTEKTKNPDAVEKKSPVVQEVKEYSNRWWTMQQENVARKIKLFVTTGEKQPITKNERISITFFNPGETKTVTVDDEKLTLERDRHGLFIRIRGVDAKGDQPNYLSIADAPKVAPLWANPTKTDRQRANVEYVKAGLINAVDWLKSGKVPEGSRVAFTNGSKTKVEFVKESEGKINVITTDEDQKHSEQVFADATSAIEYANRLVDDKTVVSRHSVTEQEKVVRKEVTEKKEQAEVTKEMSRWAAMALSVIPLTYENGIAKPAENKLFVEYFNKFQKLAEANHITNWKFNGDFIGYTMRIVNGVTGIVEINPKYDPKQKNDDPDEPKQPQYLTFFRSRTQLKSGNKSSDNQVA